ncbi:nickel pincer cofactor biosynthesis protein LarB [Candidatus Nitronereus thalassa]|uniref:Nickel pincer cofactor biosynthesis protein LarB n=1 Tax=Candidatus Nitronereus thalassa TaxID=3020898 RepID=A0ABU3K9M5_9BACT|nr:nickel pincer cofactor biosynthesis protein LarB [Candidatus Nitronereus thalassa]MDT7043067.1 nickel pincer cofactor biosynthesis protein LarB [Candidatus Nitronereus thalassa]
MDSSAIKKLLQQVQEGNLSVPKALDQLRMLPYENLGFAKVDHHRTLRQGVPEAILCEGKTEVQIVAIAKGLLKREVPVLATRATPKVARALTRISPRAVYEKEARMVVIQTTVPRPQGDIVIITAGTSDIPVAEEARVTATVMGSAVETLFDVGVAGLHRLLDHLDRLQQARVLIVIAGMDGVLPTVVGGLVKTPLIAVPTSRGYGANFGGIAPLLTMLNACSGGIGVMNIDNGFGAGHLAHRINVLPGLQELEY